MFCILTKPTRLSNPVNVIFSPPPEPAPALSPPDQAVVERNLAFRAHGFAYAQMHGTRPATAGFVLQSSPVALLSWYVRILILLPHEMRATDGVMLISFGREGSAKSSSRGRMKTHRFERSWTACLCTG